MPSTRKIPVVRYGYDALDRLTSHGQLDGVDCQRFYCDNRLVTEIKGGERLSIVQFGAQLVAQIQDQSEGATSTLLVTDLQQSILNALQAGLKQAIVYSPYGHLCASNGLIGSLGFNGQRLEPMTGHYLLGNGYRAFNPVLMRFNTPDSLSPFNEGGLNAYAYCAGDPINRSDATGHVFSALTKVLTNIKARHLSFATGEYVKPIEKLTRISEGLAIFVDKHKGGLRLNVYGHGTASGGVLKEKGILLGPKSLSEYIKSTGLHFESFDSVRLLTCHSGSEFLHSMNPSSAPFGQLFSDFSGLPVKAYKGRYMGGGVTTRLNKLKVGETSSRTDYFRILKKPESRRSRLFGASYDPVSFQPSKHIRNTGAL